MKEIMHNAVMDMCSPYLPKSFQDAKMEAEREEKLFARVVDLDERVNEKMHSVFWSDEGMSVIEKFDKKKRQKEKKFNVGPSLEVNREEEQEKELKNKMEEFFLKGKSLEQAKMMVNLGQKLFRNSLKDKFKTGLAYKLAEERREMEQDALERKDSSTLLADTTHREIKKV
jgi:hypothetical protein